MSGKSSPSSLSSNSSTSTTPTHRHIGSFAFDRLVDAWDNGEDIFDRSNAIWKIDYYGNIILAPGILIHTSFSYSAVSYNGTDRPVSVESLKYNPKTSVLMDLVELAIFGYIRGLNDAALCWTPSQIHQNLEADDQNAYEWFDKMLTSSDIFGKKSHDTIFKHSKLSINVSAPSSNTENSNTSKKTGVKAAQFKGKGAAQNIPVPRTTVKAETTSAKPKISIFFNNPIPQCSVLYQQRREGLAAWIIDGGDDTDSESFDSFDSGYGDGFVRISRARDITRPNARTSSQNYNDKKVMKPVARKY